MDSLSDIPDTPDFLPADSLSEVPTIWDVSTAPAARDKVSSGASRATLATQADKGGWQSLRVVTLCSGLGDKVSYTPGWRANPHIPHAGSQLVSTCWEHRRFLERMESSLGLFLFSFF